MPNDRAYLWIAPGRYDDSKHKINPAMDAAFVERFEFVRVMEGADVPKKAK